MVSSAFIYVELCCIILCNVPKKLLLPDSLLDETLLWQWEEIPSDFLSTDMFAASIMSNSAQFPCFDIRGDIW